MLRAPIRQLEISDGTTVDVPAQGTLIFVGPNNSGKSQALRDIRALLSQKEADTSLVIKRADVEKISELEELRTWVDQACDTTIQGGAVVYSRLGLGGERIGNLESHWQNGPPFKSLGRMITFYAAAGERLKAAEGTDNIDLFKNTPKHPLHHVYRDAELESKISGVAQRVFGQPLTLNRFAGSKVRLHVGSVEAEPVIGGPAFQEYLKEVNSLPPLETQGDGMKSFIGLLLNLSVADFSYVLIDEPEAFLHPPQARLLGQMIQEFKAVESQVFLATHNSNIVRGLLEVPDHEVAIVRLTREGLVNPAELLEPQLVSELWSDPLLRYSEVLDGLFHEEVILCESDADCRFYASILDVLLDELEYERRPELLFTHCGGYARMATVVRALRGVGVPVKVVADMDVLRDDTSLRRLIESLGGEWADVAGDWDILNNSVVGSSSYPPVNTARAAIDEIFSGMHAEGGRVSREMEAAIRDAVRGQTRWSQIKEFGLPAIPAGEAQQAFSRIDAQVREFGLFLVPVGELEGFVRDVGGHGPAWVGEVHAQRLHEGNDVQDAKQFVSDVVGL